ncbi:TPA: asparagine synthase [Candidatus Woesearchaeota archaeon]|nr:asparagine synthase [Candidatus Woesearchaeota archaeon]
MEELFVKNNSLIAQKDWETTIMELKDTKYSSNQEKLKDAILNSVKIRIPQKRFGIFFSGGVDSTTIAYLCKHYSNYSDKTGKQTGFKSDFDFICYTVGYNNAEDVIVAQKAAKQLGFKLKVIKLELDGVEKILKKVIKLLDLKFSPKDSDKNDSTGSYQNITNIVAAGVATVVYAAVKEAKKDKIDVFFSGLGSEEIFAGYQRHADAGNKDINTATKHENEDTYNADNINEECWQGLKKIWARDLLRDCTLAKKLKFTALTPYLDKDVILNAMAIDAKEKISPENKKIILRKISESLGIPKEFAWRKKKAAQYGSAVDKAIEKLAKRNGFKYKLEYLRNLSH